MIHSPQYVFWPAQASQYLASYARFDGRTPGRMRTGMQGLCGGDISVRQEPYINMDESGRKRSREGGRKTTMYRYKYDDGIRSNVVAWRRWLCDARVRGQDTEKRKKQ